MVTFDDSFSNKKIAALHSQEEERYVQTMAPQLGFEYVNLQGYTINPAALQIIPKHKAEKAEVVAFDKKQNVIQVAAKSPTNPATQQLFAALQKQRYEVVVYMCSKASLVHAWKRYGDIKSTQKEQRGVFEIDEQDMAETAATIKEIGDVQTKLKEIRTANSARRISETMELMLASAVALKASDIHIEREEGGIRLRYRFDGVLHDVVDLEAFMHERLMSRLKLLSGMKLNQNAEAQDGRFTFNLGDKEIEIRSSVIPGALGESIVMRILDPSVSSFQLENLDFDDHLRTAIERELAKPNGLILTTGPTGSGKTTLLYAFLQSRHQEGVKIITIENPVEYKLDGIVQTQIDAEYTFESGLRAILRQDPDIIMVGEIRDREVAETAIHAAQTGHLVFSTLHTNSAVASFARLMDLGVNTDVLGSSVNLILGQRLIRTLCETCKKSRPATPSETEQLSFILKTHPNPPATAAPFTIFEAVGCDQCGQSGFKGRTGVYEAIAMDEAVEEAVLRDPREHIIIEAAKAQGIPSMVEDGVTKVLKGITSLPELARVVALPIPTTDASVNENLEEKADTLDDDFLSHVV